MKLFSKRDHRFSKHDKTISVLGKGISGSVELRQSKSTPSFNYAVKTYHSKEQHESKTEYKARVLHEYHIVSQLHHCNIIQMYDYHVSFSGTTIKLYIEPGTANLAELLKSTNNSNTIERECIWKQITLGVQYMHQHDICHRDLKLENIVFDRDYKLIKTIDFATAQHLRDKEMTSMGLVGSEKYAAPETYSSIRYDGKAADVWSLGIMLRYLMTNEFPWTSATWNNPQYKAYIENRDLGVIVGESRNLTSQILDPDPETRIAVSDFSSDVWFRSIKYCDDRGSSCGESHSR
ncbi:SAT4 Serine/threonine-protein kinase HAL4/SAT4 [Candida maltosa Xu316]